MTFRNVTQSVQVPWISFQVSSEGTLILKTLEKNANIVTSNCAINYIGLDACPLKLEIRPLELNSSFPWIATRSLHLYYSLPRILYRSLDLNDPFELQSETTDFSNRENEFFKSEDELQLERTN